MAENGLAERRRQGAAQRRHARTRLGPRGHKGRARNRHRLSEAEPAVRGSSSCARARPRAEHRRGSA
eukprot:8806787-Alexandrium_andersonii.AAC.1